jgi:succinoglycan biosynthesis transport protein ExoP
LRQSSSNLTSLEAEIQGRLGGFNTEDAGYKQLVQQLQVLRESRQLYLEKSEEARLAAAQAAARIGNVSVVSEAVPESKPVSPKLWLVLVGVLVGGLLGGIGLAFLLEFMDDSLDSEADIQQYLQLPLLAKVPELAAA